MPATMTDDERQRLAEHRRRKQLLRERNKWVWLSLCSLPMTLFGVVWIGYCASRIGAINAALSGTPHDLWMSCVIFAGLLVMNLLIAFGIFCAACAVIL